MSHGEKYFIGYSMSLLQQYFTSNCTNKGVYLSSQNTVDSWHKSPASIGKL